MRYTNPTSHARPFALILSVLLATSFAYANLLCVAGGAADTECEHEAAHNHVPAPDHPSFGEAEASHQQKQDPKHQDRGCSRGSCFCVTMNTVVVQQTVAKPIQVVRLQLLDSNLAQVPSVMRILAAVAYEHGPPAIAPPHYLVSKTLSPRAPPSA